MAESDAQVDRPSLVSRVLDADERTQLQVFKAATEATAPLYGAILGALVAAKERYQVHVRTEDIAAELATNGLDTSTLTSSLEQLAGRRRAWGGTGPRVDRSRDAGLPRGRMSFSRTI